MGEGYSQGVQLSFDHVAQHGVIAYQVECAVLKQVAHDNLVIKRGCYGTQLAKKGDVAKQNWSSKKLSVHARNVPPPAVAPQSRTVVVLSRVVAYHQRPPRVMRLFV